MIFPCRQIKVLAILLLVVQLCLPDYGPVYFSELLGAVEVNHAGFACAHAGADSGHESEESPRHITLCNELDEPSLIASALVIDYSPVISTLTSSDKGALLPGYGAPIDIPPENHV